jgi:hypothetical protein
MRPIHIRPPLGFVIPQAEGQRRFFWVIFTPSGTNLLSSQVGPSILGEKVSFYAYPADDCLALPPIGPAESA